jgi:phosphoglucosamine mutase
VLAPQILVNVRSPRRDVLDQPAVVTAVAQAEEALRVEGGRLLIRPSGTEPLIRVMAEGQNRPLVERVVAQLARLIEEEIGRLTQT